MKLTITALSPNYFGVTVNSQELHKTKQSIFKVNMSDADLHQLTESRVDKDHPHQSGPVKRRKIWHEICKGPLKVKPLIRAKYPKKRICRELAVVWTSDENPHQL